jgi:hypothetical protein
MLTWPGKTRDHRASWSDDSLARQRAATADAPVAWIARSVLEAIGRSAEYGHPHPVDGELLGYWVTPRVEVVIVDWSGFGSLLFREPYVASTALRGTFGTRGVHGTDGILRSMSHALRVPLGVWSMRPVAPMGSAFESMPPLHLLLERDPAWHARLSMLSRTRWPWDALRRPREMELRVFSPPRT